MRLVSLAGADGGRDAVFFGNSSRYPDWHGEWVFQFKHYRFDRNQAQQKLLRELRQEVVKTQSNFPDVKNYVLLTSVSLTGVPQVGGFDRAQAVLHEISEETGLNVDLWDGAEIASLLILHGKASAGDEKVRAIGSGLEVLGIQSLVMPVHRLSGISTEQLCHYLSMLLSSDQDPLSPSSESPIGREIWRGAFFELRNHLVPLADEIERRVKSVHPSPELSYWRKWLVLALCLAETRTDAAKPALSRLGSILSDLDDDFALAWANNLLSMIYGKLENDVEYLRTSYLAIEHANKCGNSWLAINVTLRMLHKKDWATGEAGLVSSDGEFSDSVLAVGKVEEGAVSSAELAHIRGQQQSYLALHFRWQDAKMVEADSHLRAAQGYFGDFLDQSELNRVNAEIAFLSGKASAASGHIVAQLKEAFSGRLVTGELARGRYDLLNLAQVYIELGNHLAAECCCWLILFFHNQLYGASDVDHKIVNKAKAILRTCECELQRRALQDGLTEQMALNTITNTLGLNEIVVLKSFELKDFVHLICHAQLD
ncbi:hypothetical protein [Mameliella sp. MMSF_3537]|uniref:hypothetical protein n=1 Tax=unclassified Mameliella TaxID=2630630 RepID=UPI0035323259